jgi:hypothetical protein
MTLLNRHRHHFDNNLFFCFLFLLRLCCCERKIRSMMIVTSKNCSSFTSNSCCVLLFRESSSMDRHAIHAQTIGIEKKSWIRNLRLILQSPLSCLFRCGKLIGFKKLLVFFHVCLDQCQPTFLVYAVTKKRKLFVRSDHKCIV